MKLDFFHRIGENGADSSEVRRFLVEHDLTDRVEFRNIAFDSHKEALKARTGSDDAVPALVLEDGSVKIGKREILEWFEAQLSAGNGIK